jgi:tetratricopeptide (TPR) repeat protein
MNRRLFPILVGVLALVTIAGMPARAGNDFDAELKAVRDGWALANYRTPKEQRQAAFEKLLPQSAALAAQYPDRPEALIWDGIVLSTYAGVKGGLGALGLAKESRARLEAALAISETALDGSAHTSLGTLYHKVPGFPVGFGSDRKARAHLEKALQISPNAIDQNYFYGEFLFDEGEYDKALAHLERALRAPPRVGREVADEGRRAEVTALIARTKQKLGG